jgi:SAM-dependent methyltransferase
VDSIPSRARRRDLLRPWTYASPPAEQRRPRSALRSLAAQLPASALRPDRRSFWLLDEPDASSIASDGPRRLSGWIASTEEIHDVRFHDGACELTLDRHRRTDVEALYGLGVHGFEARIPAASAEVARITYVTCGEEFTIVVPRRAATGSASDRVRSALRCPSCTASTLEPAREGAVRCRRCRRFYARTAGGAWDFLPEAMRAEFGVTSTTNVSSNRYDGVALNIINACADGLVLDCGAGSQTTRYPNVVNVEVVDYRSTDVLAVGERLPFADASFDAVLSFAVLEHVKDPVACAAELQRVLKPDGVVYCQVPFLQPEHGFPNHYFNMTGQGLATLFPGLRDVSVGSFAFGQPIFAVTWMLRQYAAALPADARESFVSMTVGELLRRAAHEMLGDHIVTALPDEAVAELSCCNFLIGRN